MLLICLVTNTLFWSDEKPESREISGFMVALRQPKVSLYFDLAILYPPGKRYKYFSQNPKEAEMHEQKGTLGPKRILSTSVGFEPTRPKANGFQVHPINHSRMILQSVNLCYLFALLSSTPPFNPWSFFSAPLGISWGFHPFFNHYNTKNCLSAILYKISLHT